MLELDAGKRITAEQALAHPYLVQYADPTDEPVSLPYDQSFEDMDLPVEKWKGNALVLIPHIELFRYTKYFGISNNQIFSLVELVYHEAVNFVPQQLSVTLSSIDTSS